MKRLLALVLALCLLLTGCVPRMLWQMLIREDAGPLADAATMAVSCFDESGQMPSFSQLPYESPDPQALREVFETATRLAETGTNPDELMDALDSNFAGERGEEIRQLGLRQPQRHAVLLEAQPQHLEDFGI